MMLYGIVSLIGIAGLYAVYLLGKNKSVRIRLEQDAKANKKVRKAYENAPTSVRDAIKRLRSKQ